MRQRAASGRLVVVVGRATALTIKQFLASSGGGAAEGLTAEAIEGWSRSWGGRTGGGVASLAIPNRARDLLVAYQRVFV